MHDHSNPRTWRFLRLFAKDPPAFTCSYEAHISPSRVDTVHKSCHRGRVLIYFKTSAKLGGSRWREVRQERHRTRRSLRCSYAWTKAQPNCEDYCTWIAKPMHLKLYDHAHCFHGRVSWISKLSSQQVWLSERFASTSESIPCMLTKRENVKGRHRMTLVIWIDFPWNESVLGVWNMHSWTTSLTPTCFHGSLR